MSSVTFFSGFNKTVEDKALIIALTDIKDGKYEADILNIRSLIASGDSQKADALKKQLPAFTPSATFNNGRKAEFINIYSKYIHLDFDKLTSEQLNLAFSIIIQIPYTFACFRSPSGHGLKVFVQVNSDAQHHALAYAQVQEFYEKATKLTSDHKCKDITRLCFVSFDPDTFINVSRNVFLVDISQSDISINNSETPDFRVAFNHCVRFTQQIAQYLEGNRNNFIYLLASNCNRSGIPMDITSQLIADSYDLPMDEINAAVKSAFSNHSTEFAKFANFATLQDSKNESSALENSVDEDFLKNMPYIPDDVVNQLPDILKAGAEAFIDKRERDVFLTGALAIISGCLPNVSGIYAQQKVYPNLFAFIIAPAASGKGALKFAKSLADKFHDHLIKNSKNEIFKYEIELQDFKNRQRNKKKNEPSEQPPDKPPFRVAFIPANSSYAKILSHLELNQGEGIICETEADTMGNVFKQEWGGYSDMLRKSFHHERISSSKKADNEFIEVNEPRLSVALSGTPNQVANLISSAEDGLFSRFIFYAFKVEQIWRDVSPFANNNAINLTDFFKQQANQVFDLINFLNLSKTNILLSENQWQLLNNSCSKWLFDVTSFVGDDAGSIVKRLGLILFRFAMIFTALRKFENAQADPNITCTDSDFKSALLLSELYLQHSLLMFHNLPKQKDATVFRNGNNKQAFFNVLPDSFQRAQAIEIGKKFNLSARSIDTLLHKLIGKFLSQTSYGNYSKIHQL